MFVKVCGITNEDDALFAVAMGADAVGFIFAPSTRQVAVQTVYDITRRLPPEVLTVGVIAVDPTSPFSGGAILGDRIRMDEVSGGNVFIRSMATRGHLGGLSKTTRETVLVFDAMGYDVVIIETVGVGQDELEVTQLADTTLVVMAPAVSAFAQDTAVPTNPDDIRPETIIQDIISEIAP